LTDISSVLPFPSPGRLANPTTQPERENAILLVRGAQKDMKVNTPGDFLGSDEAAALMDFLDDTP